MNDVNRERKTNPELDQDRAADLWDNWVKYKYVMFPQQRRIYEGLVNAIPQDCSVLEAGCGAGVGSAILAQSHRVNSFTATDKLKENILFAKHLYPWIDFQVWDLHYEWEGSKAEVVVAVEVVEHVCDLAGVLHNLIGNAVREVWFSTPNGREKENPPSNPHHVREYTPAEVLETLSRIGGYAGRYQVFVYGYDNLRSPLINPEMTTIDPLVYRVKL